jgi:imidazolonepropionase-like amidohydrolase
MTRAGIAPKRKTEWLLVRGARQLLTLRGPLALRRGRETHQYLGALDGGAMLLCNGMIVEIGATRRVENLALSQRAEVMELNGRVVLPAFHDVSVDLFAGCVSLSAARLQLEVRARLQRFVSEGTLSVAAPDPAAGARLLGRIRRLRGRMKEGPARVLRQEPGTLPRGERLVLLDAGRLFMQGEVALEGAGNLDALVLGTGWDPTRASIFSMNLGIWAACRYARCSVEEAITAATANAAASLGISGETGLAADFVALDCGDYRELAAGPGAAQVQLVVQAGKVVWSREQVKWPER